MARRISELVSFKRGSSADPPAILAYGVAIGSVLIAAAVRWSLEPVLQGTVPFVTFYPAVVCAAWYGGVRPGIVATLLSLFLAEFLFVAPRYPLDFSAPALAVGAVLFAFVSLLLVLMGGALHQTRARVLAAGQQLLGVLGSITDDFLAIDRDWRISFINPHGLTGLGLARDQVEGRDLWELFPRLVGSELGAGYRGVMESRQPAVFSCRSPAGGRWLDVSVYPTDDGIAVHTRDVTDRRQAEESAEFIDEASRVLARSLDYDATIRRVADLAVPRLGDWCFVDLLEDDGSFRQVAIQHANPAMREVRDSLLSQYVPDASRPHPIMQAFRMRAPELVPRVTDEWLRSRARDEEHLRLLRAMGMHSLVTLPLVVQDHMLGVLTLVSAESGREYSNVDLHTAEALAVHIALAIRNARLYQEAKSELHDRKLAEGALRESENRFRTLVTATGAMVWRVAPDGRAIEAPAGWEQVTGQSEAELQNDPQGWFSRVHPQDVSRVESVWATSQAAETMVDVEFRLRCWHGNYRRMHTVGVPLRNERGDVAEWIGTTIDVHDRREAEEQLQRVQRLETIGRLAGGVAHETNNQMMVILSFVEFMARGMNLTSEQRDDLKELGKAAERVADLTRQLLALGRRQVLDTRVLDLDAVVTEAESVLKRTLGPEVHLTVVLDAGYKWVRADRTQLIQVMVNLALNARDAMPGAGEITLSTRCTGQPPAGGRFGAKWPEHPGVAMLSVADSGGGMDAATLARIFEPFFTTKPLGQGTGLGLPVVEGIVSQSGGDIWVESKPGYGTVVSIALPLTEEPVGVGEAPEFFGAIGGTETILVVDDEEQVRRMLVRGLALGDYRVIEAAGGQEAIAMLQHEGDRVQLVVTDVAMPDMSGVELARRLAALWPRLPFIFVSGHPYEVVAREEEIITHGRFLQKPFKVDTLLAVVRKALDESMRDMVSGSEQAATPQ